ncbi:MAG: helix-turn-helix transcriptional regulator [Formivibrio sp.]|nr:helix-turn-helix transcriptional regulator [Formivibrio sp.]
MIDFKVKSAQQLSTLIGDVRKLRELRQQDIAKKLNTTQQSYARMELNIGASKVETLLDILQALDVELVLRPKALAGDAMEAKPKSLRRAAPVGKSGVRIVTMATQFKKNEVVAPPVKPQHIYIAGIKSASQNTEKTTNQVIGKTMRKKTKW